MKSLAIDSVSSKMTVAARNSDKTVTVSLDIGMRQSETILPTIDYVLKQSELTAQELDYTTLCQGPGSFTGLRLAFAALKSFQMAYEIPIYGISSLKAFSFPYIRTGSTIVPVIDARKDKFYAAVYHDAVQILEDGDYTPEEIIKRLPTNEPVFICGPDAGIFKSIVRKISEDLDISSFDLPTTATDSLFTIAEEMIARQIPPLKEFEGPIYLRASEAEENIHTKK